MSPAIRQVLIALGAATATSVVLIGARALALRILQRHVAERNRDLWVDGLRTPSWCWCVALGLLVGITFSPLPDRYEQSCRVLIEVLLMISVMVVVANLSEGLIRRSLRQRGSPMSESGLIRGAVRSTVYGLGTLIVLEEMGIRIGPLLTALGVGGLAAALAFKDTAENMLSGIHLLIDRSVEVGDEIKLEGGQQGTVVDIGWRTSKITLSENGDYVLVIPNTKLAQNIMIRKRKHASPENNQEATLYKKLASR